MMKIVKIFGPMDVGPPIWDILDSDNEDSKNIWVQGDLVLQFGIFGIVMMKIVKIFGSKWTKSSNLGYFG